MLAWHDSVKSSYEGSEYGTKSLDRLGKSWSSPLSAKAKKTKSKKELWIQIGSDGVSTRIINDRLHIKSKWRMIGYLNADDPFDSEGYFDTKDIVKAESEWIQIVGRESDIINVGGKKISSGELEKIFGVGKAKLKKFGKHRYIFGLWICGQRL